MLQHNVINMSLIPVFFFTRSTPEGNLKGSLKIYPWCKRASLPRLVK